MKTSFYNYSVRYGEKVIFFNGRTKGLFTVHKQVADKIFLILQNPDKYDGIFHEFLSKMADTGFICNDNFDEYNAMMENYRENLWPFYYRLMLLPTYRCNQACWYCVQEHRHIDMTEETVERVKKHVSRILSKKKLNNFYLTWFGGEPLVRYDLMLDITNYVKKACEAHGVTMTAGITTNSLLLDKAKLEALGQLNVNFFQITIDGVRDEHNKVKHIPNGSAFDTALHNIIDILCTNPHSRVNLRINYSCKTLAPQEILKQLNEIIPIDLRHRIEISPKKIWQEDEYSIDPDLLSELMDGVIKSGYRIEAVQYGVCYVDYENSTTIFPNGKVDICNLDNQEGRAELDEAGNVVWPHEDSCHQYSAARENIICNHCKHFPICGGPCPVQRNDMVRNHGKVSCLFGDDALAEGHMREEVLRYYKEQENKNAYVENEVL